MKSPNLFLHYWSESDSILTFQDILDLEVSPQILDAIQIEIQNQLNSHKLHELFPCFNWENERFLEKWEAISKTLILQVQLPKAIWENWISALQNEISEVEFINEPVEFNPFDDPVFGSFELNEQANPLLSAEVYFEKREELEDLEERREEREERREEMRREERNEGNNEVRSDETLPKNILEELQASPKEKFFETISVTNSSLKHLVESKMTEQLASTISINQKIQFILQLFQGESDKFNELIALIDNEANAENWQEILQKNYQNYQNSDNQDAWKEFYLLVQRKFN
jgi:hypothetical protein